MKAIRKGVVIAASDDAVAVEGNHCVCARVYCEREHTLAGTEVIARQPQHLRIHPEARARGSATLAPPPDGGQHGHEVRQVIDTRRKRAARRGARISPQPAARQDRRAADQAAVEPARPVARVFARRRVCVPGDRRGPGAGCRIHLARQPGRRGDQRHRGARPRRHRPARRQAGDGRQGVPVPQVRRPRRVRHRARREGPRQAGRHHCRARADAGRHQPRRHQGARVLLYREEAEGAAEHSGLPRRPARHRDHLGRRGDQRHGAHGQEARRREDRVLGRRRRGDRVPRPDDRAGREAREHLRVRQQGRAAPSARGLARRIEATLRAAHERAHAGRRDEGRRRAARLLGRRRA